MAQQVSLELEEIYDDVEDTDEQIYVDVDGEDSNEQPNKKEYIAEYLAPERNPQLSNRRDENADDLLQLQQKMRENGEKQRKQRNITIAVSLFQSVLILGAIAVAAFAIYDGK